MTRFSLSNYFFDITRAQFIDYTKAFTASVQRSFGTECSADIRGLTVPVPKSYITVADGDSQAKYDFRNSLNRILENARFGSVGEEAWKAARYVEAIIKPINDGRISDTALAHIEFKGHLARTATFYVNHDGENVRADMLRRYPHAIRGDGYVSHDDGSTYRLCF